MRSWNYFCDCINLNINFNKKLPVCVYFTHCNYLSFLFFYSVFVTYINYCVSLRNNYYFCFTSR